MNETETIQILRNLIAANLRFIANHPNEILRAGWEEGSRGHQDYIAMLDATGAAVNALAEVDKDAPDHDHK